MNATPGGLASGAHALQIWGSGAHAGGRMQAAPGRVAWLIVVGFPNGEAVLSHSRWMQAYMANATLDPQ